MTGWTVELADYAVRSVTGGQEAIGEATVKIRNNGHQVIGRAVTTDVVEASVLAYVSAINKIIEERTRRCSTCRSSCLHHLLRLE